MNKKSMIITGSVIAMTMGFSGATFAQDEDEKKEKMLMDPMTRAELKCAKLKAEAATGTAEDKKMAEMKCAQAIEYAKEMIKKEAAKKPKPNPDS